MLGLKFLRKRRLILASSASPVFLSFCLSVHSLSGYNPGGLVVAVYQSQAVSLETG